MSNHVFDVMAITPDGSNLKLGRTWLNSKDGKFSLGFDLSSLPLSGAPVQLVSQEPWARGACPTEFALKMPVEKKDKPTYWHPIGMVKAREDDETRAFDVVFTSIPLIGNLCAFPVRPAQVDEDAIPFG